MFQALDTDGMKECREIQAQLIDSGVPVSIYALKRYALRRNLIEESLFYFELFEKQSLSTNGI